MSEINIRKANSDDLPIIVQLLADDLLGAQREDATMPMNVLYLKAWNSISKNTNSEIFVVEIHGKVIGVAQLDYLQYLTYQGGLRAQIEGVRVREDCRNKSIGKKLFQFLIERARENGCHLVQLTTDITRPAALKFYESLGFVQSHVGMKLHFEKMTIADIKNIATHDSSPEKTPADCLRILEELRQREPIFHRREYGTSRQALENMTASSFWEIGASGKRYGRDDVINLLLARYAEQPTDEFETEGWITKDFCCQKISTGNYLLTYTLIQGARITRRSTIWRYEDEAWKIVYHQGTVV